jgi:hypothetical protein
VTDRFLLFANFFHDTTVTTRETLLPGEQPGWAIHMRARKKQAFLRERAEMPYANPSGVASVEVL